MARTGIFSEDHLRLIRKLYLTQHRPTREVAAALNARFGATFSNRQVSSMLTQRGWSSKRRELKGAAILAVNRQADLVASAARVEANRSVAEEVIEGQVRVGRKILQRAEGFVDAASSAKSLSSAAAAARVGTALARGGLGLDVPGASAGGTHFHFSFARGPGSPFNQPAEPQPAEALVDVETVPE